MKETMLFIIPTICGTIIGMSLFRIMFRELADIIDVNQKLACAIGGAFLGAFGGVILSLAFPQMADWPVNYIVATTLAAVMSVGLQKFMAEQE